MPNVFHGIFKKSYTKYTLKSTGNYLVPFKNYKTIQFCISYRGPHFWNSLIKNQTKLININHPKSFKFKLKHFLQTIQHEDTFFNKIYPINNQLDIHKAKNLCYLQQKDTTLGSSDKTLVSLLRDI